VFLDTTLPHLDVVHNVARRVARDQYHADDLVQETFLRAFSAFDSHDRERTRSWLVAILLNTARSDGRRSRVRAGELLVAEPPDDHGRDDVAEAAVAAADRDAIVAALATIPEEQRLAVVLMDIAGLTAQEVADALGCPRGTVLARAHRGRRKLAGQLERDGTRP
jgi:RNA polymerase sigma-70 factor, ECF subfamily